MDSNTKEALNNLEKIKNDNLITDAKYKQLRKKIFTRDIKQNLSKLANTENNPFQRNSSNKSSNNDTVKKPFYKKWWVWTIAIVVIIGALGGNDSSAQEETSTEFTKSTTEEAPIEEAAFEEAIEEGALEVVAMEEVSDNTTSNNSSIDGYNLIEVDGGDMSTTREANVVVDIGFGDREYYAFTNEYGQVVKVEAADIILQDDSSEPVNDNGRYYPHQAELANGTLGYDNGHIIADCLGGVANAYNITPQESTLNQHGDQAYMEQIIRSANGCTDFVGIITYPDTDTMIPISYKFSFKINGEEVEPLEFKNENPELIQLDQTEPDESNDSLRSVSDDESVATGNVEIVRLDKKAEYVIIKNNSNSEVNLKGWKLLSVRGEQNYDFGNYTLSPGESLKIGDEEKNPDVDIHWLEGRGVWNNKEDDDAALYDNKGNIVAYYDD